MAESKTDLTLVVVRRSRRLMFGCGGCRGDTRNAAPSKRKRVGMPGEQHRLEEDGKDGEKRDAPARSPPPRFAGPHSRCRSPTHVDLGPPRRTAIKAVQVLYIITRRSFCEALSPLPLSAYPGAH